MHGVYLLWWVQERQVRPAAVAIALAAGDLALTAFEVPTGWLADRYGHRVSLMAGSALQVAGMLACWMGRGIAGVLAASVLIALGDAFRSGADQALLYRSCFALDREADFQRLEARTRAATLIALVALTLVGGAIVGTRGFATGWFVETALSFAGLMIACAMVEPPAIFGARTAKDASSAWASRVTMAASTHRTVSKSRSPITIPMLAALIVPASCLGGLAGAASFFAQTSAWANAERTTLLVASLTLAEAAGAILARSLSADVRIQFVLAGVGTAILVPALFHPSAILVAVVGLSFLLGIAEPLRAAAIQRSSADHVRARAASMASACDKGVATFALIGAGVLPRGR